MSNNLEDPLSIVIELNDSDDDDELDNNSGTNLRLGNLRVNNSVKIPTPQASPPKSFNTPPIPEPEKPFIELAPAPKRVINRRKSVHHSIRSTENLSFDGCPVPNRKRRESLDNIFDQNKNKNSRSTKEQINDVVDKNVQDPEMEKILKKIAYCRVFTNYLLQQYQLLAIDFKLYSNFDLLNLDLQMRMETFNSIMKSRQRLKEARENNGKIEL